MDSLIPIVNELQEILCTMREGSYPKKAGDIPVDLPEIAVVGSQSVGKSSLLDYIIGRRILPRGHGIVTRRPLILQLQQIYDNNKEDYAEFGHKKGIKFTDFEKVREEIQIETNRLVGDNKKVSDNPILLRVHSKRTINLTLVDLPGLTKVPVEDQPSDIDLQIRKIVLSYIKRPSCLILAITAANTDIANSDSLKIAREVDPEGKRTIGVLSKLDTVENYTSIVQILDNKLYPLSKGHIAVMCRDLKQRNSEIKSLRASLNEEKSFFENNINLKSVINKCGTYNLMKILQKELLDHITMLLPHIRNQAKEIIEFKKEELTSYGDFSPFIFDNYDEINAMCMLKLDSNNNDAMNKGALILDCFSKFSRKFQDMIEGKASYKSGIMRLSGGARINYVFHSWFGNTLFKFNPLDGLTDDEIITAIKNSTGTRSSLFVSEGAFEILSRIQIKKLLKPSLSCVEQVYNELKTLLYQCTLPELIRYENLKNNIIKVIDNVLQESLGPTKKAIIDLINIELSYINTNHPDFIGGASSLTNIFENDVITPKSFRNNKSFNNKISNSNQEMFENQEDSLENSDNQRLLNKKVDNKILLNDFFKAKNEKMMIKSTNTNGDNNNISNNSCHLTGNYISKSQYVSNVIEHKENEIQSASNSKTESFEYCSNDKIIGMENNKNYLRSGLFDTITRAFKNSSGGGVNENFNLQGENKNIINPINISLKTVPNSVKCHDVNIGIIKDNIILKNNAIDCNVNLSLPTVPDIITTSDGPTERERVESEVIKFFIVSYFNIVKKNIADSVPKTIMYFMVNAVKDKIQRELITKLYKEEMFDNLLLENQEIVEKRKNCCKYIENIENITCRLENLISNFK
ncbi:hypothetical protein FG386_001541 [Cryptosporidium ryanae]|uniref:uncharacterized protein n=1 Tax=Cryptosporidium ryanae TaxID=515981 RepID=UPI00351A1628|nr:hypothetical protein FG386_001541 [Cryptosporidium ryanae]